MSKRKVIPLEPEGPYCRINRCGRPAKEGEGLLCGPHAGAGKRKLSRYTAILAEREARPPDEVGDDGLSWACADCLDTCADEDAMRAMVKACPRSADEDAFVHVFQRIIPLPTTTETRGTL